MGDHPELDGIEDLPLSDLSKYYCEIVDAIDYARSAKDDAMLAHELVNRAIVAELIDLRIEQLRTLF